MSSDGRFVVFNSADKLVPEDEFDGPDVYVMDVESGELSLLSVAPSDGRASVSNSLRLPSISGDGETVVFADMNVSPVGRKYLAIYAVSRRSGAIERLPIELPLRGGTGVVNCVAGLPVLSLKRAGLHPAWDLSLDVSSDGRRIVFVTRGRLSHRDRDRRADVYLYDRDTQRLELVSSGMRVSTRAQQPAVSGDGRHVAYLASWEGDDGETVYAACVRELLSDAPERISASGVVAYRSISISADGAFVVYLAAGDGWKAALAYDRVHEREEVLWREESKSHEHRGLPNSWSGDIELFSPGNPRGVAVSGDGARVAIELEDSSRMAWRYFARMYVFDRTTREQLWVPTEQVTDWPERYTGRLSMSHDGRHVAFRSNVEFLDDVLDVIAPNVYRWSDAADASRESTR